jgi:hypothetical protein
VKDDPPGDGSLPFPEPPCPLSPAVTVAGSAFMIVARNGRIEPLSGHDHGSRFCASPVALRRVKKGALEGAGASATRF